MNNQESFKPDRVRQIIGLLDLTNLNDDCDKAAIDELCAQASTPVGPVAAVCVWPEFVGHAQTCFGADSDIRIATVVNFPGGNEKTSDVCAVIESSLAEGATEIDYVLPYTDLVDGRQESVSRAVNTIRKSIPNSIGLKVILESGVLADKRLIHQASQIAIDQGADFIKTSTGKVSVNATLEAGTVMLEVIAGSGGQVGFKASGGIRSVQQACEYLVLAEDILGTDWVNASHFRFGASSLLQDALASIDYKLE